MTRRPAARPSPRGAPAPALEFARWIVFEDADLVAVDKPAGVLSQSGEGGAGVNLVDLARAHYGAAALPKPGVAGGGLGVAHRIDRNVSGLVLMARTPRAARGLAAQIARGAVEREYAAVVAGAAPPGAFGVGAWLRKDPARNEVRALDAAHVARLPPAERGEYKPARTEVLPVARWRARVGPCATLRVWPLTGRSHQIRAHLAYVGLGLLGDPKYGRVVPGLDRPLLHARRLAFAHPVTAAPLELVAPPPWDDRALAELLGGALPG